MPWFRLCAIVFAAWAILFTGFPHLTNEVAAIDSTPSRHADDWTQIVGLFCLGFAVLLEQAHRSANELVRQVVARSVVALALPSALLLTYWQLIPDRRWTRLDIGTIALLLAMTGVLMKFATARKSQRSARPVG